MTQLILTNTQVFALSATLALAALSMLGLAADAVRSALKS